MLDPSFGVGFLVALGLYLYALTRLEHRGFQVPLSQRLSFVAGITLWTVALSSAIDLLAQDLFSAHMAQHLLIAEVGAPLILIGIRSPVLFFMLPKSALKRVARLHRFRRAFAVLTRPVVAIFLYIVILYSWHFVPLFEGALESPALHALQHQSFVLISVLVWWSAIEPAKRRVSGKLWKVGHIMGARVGGMFLGMAFIAMRSPVYEGFYGDRAAGYGLTSTVDQQIGGGMMLTLDMIIILIAAGYFFYRTSEDEAVAHGRAQPTPS